MVRYVVIYWERFFRYGSTEDFSYADFLGPSFVTKCGKSKRPRDATKIARTRIFAAILPVFLVVQHRGDQIPIKKVKTGNLHPRRFFSTLFRETVLYFRDFQVQYGPWWTSLQNRFSAGNGSPKAESPHGVTGSWNLWLLRWFEIFCAVDRDWRDIYRQQFFSL